jgi:uncharacterized protein YggT (Ycf19 family)
MAFIDLILNLAALLLWLKWRDNGRELSAPGISLLGTLRKVDPRPARFWFLLALMILILLRPVLYWVLGPAVNWIPRISLGVIAIPFRSIFFGRMFLFSLLSFAVTLGIFYLCLILFSILNGRNLAIDPVQNLVREQLGKLDFLPAILKLLLPFFFMFLLWCLLNKPLVAMEILPAPKSILHLIEQGVVVALGIYLAWKYLILAVLLLHLLNSYIYFGAWPFWNFIDNSARQILKLISWIPLRVGKIDFAPLVGMAVMFFVAEYASRGLLWIYQRLPV